MSSKVINPTPYAKVGRCRTSRTHNNRKNKQNGNLLECVITITDCNSKTISKKTKKNKRKKLRLQKITTQHNHGQLIIRDTTLFKAETDFNFYPADKVVSFMKLDNDSVEFQNIVKMITNRYLIVDVIEKVHNLYLQKAYDLKKAQKLIEYPNLQEKYLFHGTKRSKLMSICMNNFNWRCAEHHRFGKGVNFSMNAKYASEYSDRTEEKFMFLAQVLVGKSCIGLPTDVKPPFGYDTTTKNNNGIVTVKYEDHEFYPTYLITFHFENSYDSSTRSSSVYSDQTNQDYYDYNASQHKELSNYEAFQEREYYVGIQPHQQENFHDPNYYSQYSEYYSYQGYNETERGYNYNVHLEESRGINYDGYFLGDEHSGIYFENNHLLNDQNIKY